MIFISDDIHAFWQ